MTTRALATSFKTELLVTVPPSRKVGGNFAKPSIVEFGREC